MGWRREPLAAPLVQSASSAPGLALAESRPLLPRPIPQAAFSADVS